MLKYIYITNITLYCPKSSPRIQYLVNWLNRQIEEPIECTQNAKNADICYGLLDAENALCPSHALLQSKEISIVEFDSFLKDFAVAANYLQKGDWSDRPTVDLLAFAFVCLSRYEEYLPFPADSHERYISTESQASKLGFLEVPLVDHLLLYIQSVVKELSGKEISIIAHPNIISTFDIDHAWRYQNRGFGVTIGSLAKALVKGNIGDAIKQVALGSSAATDPYDLEYWMQHYDMDATLFFFLLAERNTYDKGIHPSNSKLQTLLSKLSKSHRIGLHPSYHSSRMGEIASEVSWFEKITGGRPAHSRQHYLRLSLPSTYRLLIKHGIKADYTMGYASSTGFRASTCRPFTWFDLESNSESSLTINPFCLMDVTLKNYMQLSGQDAVAKIGALQIETQKVFGSLCYIWHNSSPPWIDEWKDYGRVLDRLLQKKP